MCAILSKAFSPIMKSCFVLCLLLVHQATLSSVQQCQNWVFISPDDYSYTFVPLRSPEANTARPIGFRKASLQTDGPGQCFTVSGLAGMGRHIEIKWAFDLPQRLCLNDSVSGNEPKCSGNENYAVCDLVPAGADTIKYTFVCMGNGCDQGEITFWHRFVAEPAVGGGFDPDWCKKRDAQFPTTLDPIDVPIRVPIVPPNRVDVVTNPPKKEEKPIVADDEVTSPSSTDPPLRDSPETTTGGVTPLRGTACPLVLSVFLVIFLFAIQVEM